MDDVSAPRASRYSPPTSFRPQPIAAIAAFVEARALCTLVGLTGEGLHACNLPVVADRADDGALLLRGHVARANLGWRAAGGGSPALAIFAGEDDYGVPEAVRAADRQVRGLELYGAVHLYGRLNLVEDEAFLAANMQALTRRHAAGRAHVWNTDTTPAAVLERLTRQVIGVEMRIERAEACLTHAAACERPGL